MPPCLRGQRAEREDKGIFVRFSVPILGAERVVVFVRAGKARCGVDRFSVPILEVERIGVFVRAGKARCVVDRLSVPILVVERV